MINNVRNTVLSIINKDNNGYLTPEEFNLLADMSQKEIFTQIFHDYSRAVVKRNNRQFKDGYGDVPEKIKETIQRFHVEGVLTWDAIQYRYFVPADSFWLKDVFYNTNTPVELKSPSEARQLLRMLDVQPTTDYPIGVIYENANLSTTDPSQSLQIYPSTITGAGQITADYIRYPKTPKWTYTGLSDGEPVFNQSANDYQDFELPDEYMDNLVNKIVSYSATLIREPEVINVAKMNESTEKQYEQ